MFDQLTSVKMGDYFYIETAGRHLKYQVTDIRVVLPHETESLNKVEARIWPPSSPVRPTASTRTASS